MKRKDLIGYLQDPARLDQSSLPEVEELIDAFPYFQTAYMLRARNHHNLDSLKFSEMLRSAAAYAGDRTLLYHLINPAPDEGASGRAGLSGKLAEILSRDKQADELEFSPAYTLDELPDPPGNDVEAPPVSIDEYTFTGWFDHIREDEGESEPLSEQSALIEKFLDERPGIKPGPKDDMDVSDRSEPFTRAGDPLMTETLARIYEQQGLYKKAIYAYEKLSLKYPEKSTYFATLINRLKSNLEEN